ncbi:hypothetical protein [Brunnivagina elsteri]|uniref:Spore coat protein U domain-containing protein n=1 Tax=Brunnivagina elsteri CCALA 953 TaxID=987040 RepID=A0A2A2TA41_9CYAN|nr:hypothetical protein [Calothrix elsteri]PAX45756.1 hypothetical protein CK510_30030 [Calothrix elsteri CCALA 953]
MLRRSLLVSAVLLAGSFGFVGSAKAAPGPSVDATVQFGVSLGNTCVWGTTPTVGVLAVNGADDGLETTTPASVNINCNGSALLTVAAPTQLPGTGETTTNNIATLTTSIGTTTDTGTGVSVTSTGINEDVTVSMTADTVASPQVGSYSYEVVVTAAPL